MEENLIRTDGIRYNDWQPTLPEPEKRKAGKHMGGSRNPFWRDYKILLIAAAAFTIYTILLSSGVKYSTEKKAEEITESAVRSAVTTRENHIFDVLEITPEQFKEMEKAKEEGQTTILTGEASRQAHIEREISAVAAVISKLNTDQQKLTEASCMLARVKNPSYPNTFQDVAAQPQQWMFYDGTDKDYQQHDYDLAESIVRPYLEKGIIPNGLTAEMVHGNWSTNDYILRDSYENVPNMTTWRYQG